jgi:tRNA A37 threonylcarbamoyladenosine dehydratase
MDSDVANATTDTDRRFGGLSRLYGVQGAQRIRQAHVAVVGVGGVGSWAVECLARSGVGQLTLIDMDHVSESNINRQLHALSDTLGQSKVLAMQARIVQINPQCEVHVIDDFITPENIQEVLPGDLDAVIDACDQVSAKVALAAWAIAHKVLLVTVGAAGGKMQAHLVDMADLAQATHDPLLVQVRQRLRKHHAAPAGGAAFGVQSVFSKESVLMPTNATEASRDSSLNCHGYGSVVTVTATFGNCAAGWVLNQLAA